MQVGIQRYNLSIELNNELDEIIKRGILTVDDYSKLPPESEILLAFCQNDYQFSTKLTFPRGLYFFNGISWGIVGGNSSGSGSNITESELDKKVDKELGKGLSSNDYTNEDKSKVDKIKTDGNNIEFLSGTGEYVQVNGKVRLSENDELKYLNELIDNISIVIKNNKLVARTLEGMEVSISDLNSLKGATGNLQDQINALSKPMTMYGIYDTYDDLLNASATKAPIDGSTAIVQHDVNNNNKQWTYVYVADFTKWEPIAESTVTLRDFSTNPIDLTKEVTGKLPVENIDIDSILSQINTGEHSNQEVLDNLSTNELFKLFFYGKQLAEVSELEALSNRIEEVFQNVDDGKKEIASAITDKGIITSENDSFTTMADNIRKIFGSNYEDIYEALRYHGLEIIGNESGKQLAIIIKTLLVPKKLLDNNYDITIFTDLIDDTIHEPELSESDNGTIIDSEEELIFTDFVNHKESKDIDKTKYCTNISFILNQ